MEGSDGSSVGIGVHLLNVLSRKFGFKVNLRLEEHFIQEFPNGSIAGVIEKVMTERCYTLHISAYYNRTACPTGSQWQG